jgi:alpha-tubulin suppressor-like RCC1 family protein
VTVEGVGGTGRLSGVTSISSSADQTFCARLTSGRLDCWGYGQDGELGNGTYDNSPVPMTVKGTGGTGTLTSVASLTSDQAGFCALLTTGRADCWGNGEDGELGNVLPQDSDIPVQVSAPPA